LPASLDVHVFILKTECILEKAAKVQKHIKSLPPHPHQKINKNMYTITQVRVAIILIFALGGSFTVNIRLQNIGKIQSNTTCLMYTILRCFLHNLSQQHVSARSWAIFRWNTFLCEVNEISLTTVT